MINEVPPFNFEISLCISLSMPHNISKHFSHHSLFKLLFQKMEMNKEKFPLLALAAKRSTKDSYYESVASQSGLSYIDLQLDGTTCKERKHIDTPCNTITGSNGSKPVPKWFFASQLKYQLDSLPVITDTIDHGFQTPSGKDKVVNWLKTSVPRIPAQTTYNASYISYDEQYKPNRKSRVQSWLDKSFKVQDDTAYNVSNSEKGRTHMKVTQYILVKKNNPNNTCVGVRSRRKPITSYDNQTPRIRNSLPLDNDKTPCIRNILPSDNDNKTPHVRNILPSDNDKTPRIRNILPLDNDDKTPPIRNILPSGSDDKTPRTTNILPADNDLIKYLESRRAINQPQRNRMFTGNMINNISFLSNDRGGPIARPHTPIQNLKQKQRSRFGVGNWYNHLSGKNVTDLHLTAKKMYDMHEKLKNMISK